MEWQSIETAPKDGTRMIVASEINGAMRVFVGGFDPHWSGNIWVSENSRVSSGYIPTHWMPLPAPPPQEHSIPSP